MSRDPRRALDRARDILEAVDLDLWSHLRDAYDMRNVLTHEYFRVDAGIVWETVQHELPVLEKMLQKFVLKESV